MKRGRRVEKVEKMRRGVLERGLGDGTVTYIANSSIFTFCIICLPSIHVVNKAICNIISIVRHLLYLIEVMDTKRTGDIH
jgi:hypothetical protein